MNKRKLYITLLSISIAGYIWLFFSSSSSDGTHFWRGCGMKQFFHIPCPACGSTRAMRLLLTGEFKESLLLNPNGLVLLSAMMIIPLWIVMDLLLNKDSFYNSYQYVEQKLKNKRILFSFLFLYLINWGWNLMKFL